MPGETRRESTKGAVLKNRAPLSKEVLKVQFPRPKEAKLKNGLTVLVMEDHRLPTVLLQVQLRSGSLSEPSEAPGLASMTADLLKEGAGSRNSLEIAQQLDRMGAGFFADAEFGTDVTNIGISGLSEHTDGLVSQLSDLVLRPTFPAEELRQYRERQLASLAQQRAQAGFLVNERFMQALYPNHPAHVIAPTEASLNKVTRDELARFHTQTYLPNNAILAITGDVKMEEVIPKLEKAFGSWKAGTLQSARPSEIKDSEAMRILLVNRPGSVQTNLKMGNVGLTRTDPDYVTVVVLNRILGAESSSRLFLKLREELGYTYGAYSAFQLDSYRGPWSASGEVRTDVTEPSLTEFINQINKIRMEKVTAQELDLAKRSIVARFALSLERPQSLTGRALELRRFGLPADYWDKFPERVQSVTPEDIQRVAGKYLDPKKMQVVAVGDASKIRDTLKKFGEVVEYDVSGQPVKQP